MSSVSKRFITSLLLSTWLLAFHVIASSKSGEVQPAVKPLVPYVERQDVQVFINQLVKQHKLDKTWVTKALQSAQRKDTILEAISRPAEKKLNWGQYRNIFLGEKRIQSGVIFWRKYEDVINSVSKQYQVEPEIIVAIIGVETFYGRHAGKYRVVDALATLGFDYPPRSEFFAKQLGQFLLLAKEQELDPLTLKGSYAGAMGWGQFIPSSYRSYAVDFDGDKVADIWNNPADAIASVANYFKRHKWTMGQPVAEQIKPAAAANKKYINRDREPKASLAELKKAGFYGNLKPEPAQAMVLELENAQGMQTWLAYPNFYVITRYNHSNLYAMAVYQLSQAIKAAKQKSS